MPILIHYGELALKGKNRGLFEEKLADNIRSVCYGRVKRLGGRLVAEDCDIDSLKKIFGISWFADTYRVKKDLNEIKEIIVEKLKDKIHDAPTFGVVVKRSDKSFPFTSPELAKMIGEEVRENYNLKVRLNNPDLVIYVEIAEECFIYFHRIFGLGGLPVGVSGKVLCLLSGGIDSPVAAYLMMKRGCKVDYIHFHTFSRSKDILKSKIKDIVGLLDAYGLGSRLFLAPYHPFQLALIETGVPTGYELVLFRRMMLKVAEEIAKKWGHKGIITGDSVGQVASQTLDNLRAVMEGISLPVLQPLIGFDKLEIIDLAKDIGSYEFSIKPYKDCCSILAPHPKTKVNMDRLEILEKKIGMKTVVRETLDSIELQSNTC